NSTVYTAKIVSGVSGVKDAAGNALASDYSWSFTTVAGDITPPTVSSVTPLNGATAVSITTTVTAIFNEAMNAATINNSTVELRNASNTLITAVVSYNAGTRTVTLTPSAALVNATFYTAKIISGTSGVKDAAGNALASDYTWAFTTVAAASQSPVTIQSVTTKTGTTATVHSLTGVPAAALLVLATTADAIPSNGNVSSSPSLTWTKRSDAGATSSDNAEIWTAVYTAGGAITVTSNWGAESQSSVCYVVLNAESSFAGASAIATLQSAPSVAITTTKDNSIIIGCSADWKAINGTTRTLRDAATERLYFRDGSYTTYHYTKAAATIGAYTEGISLPTGQQSSTALLEIRSAAVTADITPPTVASVTPVNGVTGVSVTTAATAIFNEAMNAATINNSTIELRNASNALITAIVSYNTGTRTATLAPSAALNSSTIYTAKIISGASGVKDAAGNALANDYSWSFTTVAADITPPTVSSVTPVNGTTGVSVSTTATAIFSEAMNATTINSSAIELRNSSNALIAAVVSYNAGTRTVTLTPSAALTNSTVYTAKIISGTSGVKDAAGNALASDYIWSFTTVAADITPPTVSSVTPVNGATGVVVSTTATAIFNEAMSAATINSSTIELRNSSNALITTIVSYNAGTRTVTLTPSSALTNSTVYTVKIISGTSGVKDAAGNALANDYSWSFTTVAATSQSPVTIQSVTTKTGTAAIVHSLTGVPAGALLVLSTTADAVPSNCSVSSSPALTWTKRVDAGATSSDNAEIWTAVYTAGGSITVTSNWGAESQTSVCYVVINAEATLGGASATATLQSTPSVAITTTRTNSIIIGCTADWKAINGTTRTLRDAAIERLYFKDGNYTTYHYTKAAATIGTYTEGVSLPTGQQASTALLEIRSAATATRGVNPAVNAITIDNAAIQSHSLGQNYPNPFNRGTNIPFTISKAEKVNLVLFDINGRAVKVLVNASKDAGSHTVNFDAGSLAKGIYYYRIKAGDFTGVKKLIIW
ncbi:MAG: Ig-like domain-containing protein, partial [Chitinophagaceae bacterium]